MSLGKKKMLSQGDAGGVVGTDHFAPVLYTGNGSTQTITGLNFQPDMVWLKSRTAAFPPYITDSIRGTGNVIRTSEPDAQSSGDGVSSFDSNGFKVSGGGSNQNNGSYVAWAWKASTSFSHSGSGTLLASSGKSNQDSGFSIVKFDYPTGNSSTVRTVKHNLSTAPTMILYKPYIMTASGNSNWFVYHNSMGAGKEMYLNFNLSEQTDSNRWNNTAPTGGANGVVTLGTSFSQYADNFYGGTTIMYCFHDVPGYQKVGGYQGNGGTNAISLGFQPRFLLLKNRDANVAWVIMDSVRGFDPTKWLHPNEVDAEYTDGTSYITVTASGFTMKTNDVYTNKSGDDYIYLAIA